MRSSLKVAVVLLVAIGPAACSGTPSNTPAPAPPGAADQGRGPRAGAAPATCRDLPTASDLKEYLRRAPA